MLDEWTVCCHVVEGNEEPQPAGGEDLHSNTSHDGLLVLAESESVEMLETTI